VRFLKIALALIGLGLAVVAEKLNQPVLVYVAMGCLIAAVLLRFAERRKG
jgi:hypothetical protein